MKCLLTINLWLLLISASNADDSSVTQHARDAHIAVCIEDLSNVTMRSEIDCTKDTYGNIRGTANNYHVAMLLMYNMAIALFIGLGPLFILCLIFEQTTSLFSKWLMYGIGTLFAMTTLGVGTVSQPSSNTASINAVSLSDKA